MSLFPADPFPAPVELRLFGGISILVDGQPPTRPTPRKAFAVLARLTLAPGHRCRRQQVASDLWPEVEAESQRLYDLRRALSSIRKLIGMHQELIIQPAQDYLQLNLDCATIDVVMFDEFVVSTDPVRTEAAVRLYSGPLLNGFDESWVTFERQKRQSAYLRAISVLRNGARASGDFQRVINLCRMAIKIDPTQEREHRELITALADSGDIDAAVSAFKQCARLIKRHLGNDPEPETRELYRRIVTGFWHRNSTVSESPSRYISTVSAGAFHRPITSFLGRNQETQKLCTLVRANRLVTMTAGGGFGKTRLSLHLAEIMSGEFDGGIWFVDLAAITDPELVLASIMERFDVREQPGVSRLQALKTKLQANHVLIILDNCEHLREECGMVALSLLTSAAQLRVLATSRQSLGVTGEAVFRLGPLESPKIDSAAGADLNPETLQDRFPAIALFVERARAHGVFEFTPGSISAVIRICARLDGNALALEMAAVQTRAYSVGDLDRNLDDMLANFTTNDPTVDPRQRTLKALIGWSLDLLPESEARLLARLSVFRGSWTLATVAVVCGVQGIDPKTVPTLVANLADKSMIETIVGPSGATSTVNVSMRFRLLEMVRVYAREQLDTRGAIEAATVTESYLAYYVSFAERLKHRLATDEQQEALDQMELERDNLRGSLELALAGSNASFAHRLANSMWRYWQVRGHYSEGLSWFNRAIGIVPTADPELQHESYLHAGNIAYTALRLSEARGYFEKYLESETEFNDPVLAATARASIALLLESDGAYDAAIELHRRAFDEFLSCGRNYLAAVSQSNLAGCYVGLGNYARAIELYRDAIGTFRALNLSNTTDFTQPMIGYSGACAEHADLPTALSALNESMPQVFALGSIADIQRALLVYLCIAVKQSAFETAASLIGAYESHNDRHRLVPTLRQGIIHDRDLSATRDALGESFQASFDRGYELAGKSLEEYLQQTFH